MAKHPSHLFVSSSDGALYDTRAKDWSKNPPLRATYRAGQRNIESCAGLKAALRYGSHTDLGGYPLYFITGDGAALSFDAVRSKLRNVIWSIQNKVNDGWRVVAVDINYEDADLYCAHTNNKIPSAYGEDDSEAIDED
jgi:hypothetical protein